MCVCVRACLLARARVCVCVWAGQVGPICVDPSYQGRGVGRMLVSALMNSEPVARHVSVRLTQEAHNVVSFSLYSSFGFVQRDLLLKLTGVMRSNSTTTHSDEMEVRELRSEDITHCNELHKACIGMSRLHNLTVAASSKTGHIIVDRKTNVICGYSTGATPEGHSVASSESVMRFLLLASYAGSEVILYCPQKLFPGLFEKLLRECGLKIDRMITLMAKGIYTDPIQPSVYLPSVIG